MSWICVFQSASAGTTVTKENGWRVKFLAFLSHCPPLSAPPVFPSSSALVPGSRVGCGGRVQLSLWAQETISPRLGSGISTLR